MDKLAKLQTFIGKEFTDSPSPFMRWLNPIVVSAEEGHLEFLLYSKSRMAEPDEEIFMAA